MITEKPIIFSTPMVQSILKGWKTETRRLNGLEKFNINPDAFSFKSKMKHIARLWDSTKEENPNPLKTFFLMESVDGLLNEAKCPYYKADGDLLWVRESYAPDYFKQGEHAYKADWNDENEELISAPKWKPSIHMPKVAARIWLRIESVKPERLLDITEEGALAEGIERRDYGHHVEFKLARVLFKYYIKNGLKEITEDPILSFKSLWNLINGSGSHKANPWVWVVKFRVVSTTGKENISHE